VHISYIFGMGLLPFLTEAYPRCAYEYSKSRYIGMETNIMIWASICWRGKFQCSERLRIL